MSRHPTDYLSLIFGTIFAAVGLVLLAGTDGALSLSWIAPLAAIALGGLLIVAARSSHPAADDATPD